MRNTIGKQVSRVQVRHLLDGSMYFRAWLAMALILMHWVSGRVAPEFCRVPDLFNWWETVYQPQEQER
jgi:hypothetical protein